MITAPVAQPTTPAVFVVFSEAVTVVVPVKSSKPDIVCRFNTIDWPLILRVSSEGPDGANASVSEDMGGVKLPGAEADDFSGGVMVGVCGDDDDVVGDNAAATPYILVAEPEVLPVDGPAAGFFAGTWLPWGVELLIVDDDERGEPRELEFGCALLEI